MLPPVDFGRIASELSTPFGWIELALVAVCFAGGWALAHRMQLKSARSGELVRVGMGGINRVIFPLVSLVLLVLAHAIFRLVHTPFFLSMALPLAIALALIRLCVYALRGLFGNASWMAASERAISFAIWALVILYFFDVLPQIGAELDEMQISIGKTRVSVLEIAKGLVVVMVTVAAALWVSAFIEHKLSQAQGIDVNLRVVLSKVLRALLLVIGVLFALQAVGIDLTLLTVFGGAIAVGIGLGLQRLASNYIAGFTILLDRSIRLGDMITVDGRHGIVSSVTSRYVVVKSLDGIEAIVPNETLITTTVLNYTYTSKNARVGVVVQVSYDSDVELALELMTAAGNSHRRVIHSPSPPTALVTRFAENGIELELGVWIGDPEVGQGELRSTLHREILAAFRKHGIRIPFPQRELRILDGEGAGLAPSAAPAAGLGKAPPTRPEPQP
jgi:small-conductance mechanosensitive channel